MRSLLRWSGFAAVMLLTLPAVPTHADPKPRSPQACTPTNVALFGGATPSCGSTLQATVGAAFTFSVEAADADGDSVDVDVSGLPAGAQLSIPLPTRALTASTSVNWTPAAGDTGSHVITFRAADGRGGDAQTCGVPGARKQR